MNASWRTLVIALLTMVLSGSMTAAAWAHAGGLSPMSVRSVVAGVTPEVPGLTVTAIENGARLRVRNDTGSRVEVPPSTAGTAPVRVAPGASATWIDPRATALERDLGAAATGSWTVPVVVGATTVAVAGEFVAETPPPAAAWWAATILLAVAVVLTARRTRRPDVGLAIGGLITAVGSLAHVVGATLAVESAPLPGAFVEAAGIGLLVWPLVGVAAVAALRGRAEGVLGVCVGAGLSVVFALPDVTVFHLPILPFIGPADLERLLITVVLGLGGGVAAAGAAALRAMATRRLSTPIDSVSEASL